MRASEKCIVNMQAKKRGSEQNIPIYSFLLHYIPGFLATVLAKESEAASPESWFRIHLSFLNP